MLYPGRNAPPKSRAQKENQDIPRFGEQGRESQRIPTSSAARLERSRYADIVPTVRGAGCPQDQRRGVCVDGEREQCRGTSAAVRNDDRGSKRVGRLAEQPASRAR